MTDELPEPIAVDFIDVVYSVDAYDRPHQLTEVHYTDGSVTCEGSSGEGGFITDEAGYNAAVEALADTEATVRAGMEAAGAAWAAAHPDIAAALASGGFDQGPPPGA